MNEHEKKHYTAIAKTTVAAWFDASGQPYALREQLLRGVNIFLDEIQRRDHWSECLTVALDDEIAPPISASACRLRITPYKEGLAVSTVVPAWGFGWSRLLRDAHVYETLSWFGHYARQYVHRSDVAKVLMIAWEANETILHPFGSQVTASRYGAVGSPVTASAALNYAVENVRRNWGSPASAGRRSRSRWLSRNTLDPGIHQGIFHFLRAQRLMAAGFEIEAIVAFDCVIGAVQAMNWTALPESPRNSRSNLYTALALPQPSVALADHIYFLRNEFGAHAGGWRWWDVGELLDRDLLSAASRLALTILHRAADLEPSHRTFEPHPARWADWLIEHFSEIWRVTWFK